MNDNNPMTTKSGQLTTAIAETQAHYVTANPVGNENGLSYSRIQRQDALTYAGVYKCRGNQAEANRQLAIAGIWAIVITRLTTSK